MSWRADGHISFAATITQTQRDAVNAVLAAHDPSKVPPAAEYANRIAAGLRIVSTDDPELNGTYAIDAAARANITAIVTSLAIGLGLPLGGSTVQYSDLEGSKHAFTADAFKAFAAAVRDYVYSLDLTAEALAAGQPTSWPTPIATIT